MNQKPIGPLAVIAKYFGKLPGQDLAGFRDETAKLSNEDKLELAQGAVARRHVAPGVSRGEVPSITI